jgi:hypothetical protein
MIRGRRAWLMWLACGIGGALRGVRGRDVVAAFPDIWLLAKGRSTGEAAAITGRGMRAKYGARPCGLGDRFARRGERCWSRGQNSSLDRPAMGFNQIRPWSVTDQVVEERQQEVQRTQLRLSGYSAILTTSTLPSFK